MRKAFLKGFVFCYLLFFLGTQSSYGWQEDQVSCMVQDDRIVLRFHGHKKIFLGKQKIKLKKLMYRNCDLDHNGYRRLSLVKLVAKSRFGFGQASLRVGDDFSSWKRVGFAKRRRYKRVFFEAPNQDRQGPWQVWLKGKLKVKKIVLFFDRSHW